MWHFYTCNSTPPISRHWNRVSKRLEIANNLFNHIEEFEKGRALSGARSTSSKGPRRPARRTSGNRRRNSVL